MPASGWWGRSCEATRTHLAGVVQKVRVMRVDSLRLLRGIQADVLPPEHLEEIDHQ